MTGKPSIAPLCSRAGCCRPVKRSWGQSNPSARGLRIVDGLRWRWFCSKRCASFERMAHVDGRQQCDAARRANIRRGEQRLLQRLVNLCKGARDANGKVDPKDMVKALMTEFRRQYQRQYRKPDQRIGVAS